ncbi:uncharacterized protein LOC125567957 [Nematostella vectensis]|uniref:uncharacterized protein LOC125567957 n=1 Tax=Nematostella vectensis TaxID=45351 RepID=UPI0020772FD3|nr:uncharacterized protein LOC125567957 [Nematostella vectensis]
MTEWEPALEDVYKLMREPTNIKDTNAVAIVRKKADKTVMNGDGHPNTLVDDYEVIRHIPKLMSTWVTKYLKRPTNCEKVVVKGKWVNRGGGYGLEIPCEYIFEGDSFSSSWLKRKLFIEEFDATDPHKTTQVSQDD